MDLTGLCLRPFKQVLQQPEGVFGSRFNIPDELLLFRWRKAVIILEEQAGQPDDAVERILQVMGDDLKEFILGGIGVLQFTL